MVLTVAYVCGGHPSSGVRIGYEDVLSIEHEDLALPPIDGVKQSVALLRRVMPGAAA